MIDERHNLTSDKGESAAGYSNASSVNVNISETLGVIVLGIVALTLLIALLRAQAHNRQLSANE